MPSLPLIVGLSGIFVLVWTISFCSPGCNASPWGLYPAFDPSEPRIGATPASRQRSRLQNSDFGSDWTSREIVAASRRPATNPRRALHPLYYILYVGLRISLTLPPGSNYGAKSDQAGQHGHRFFSEILFWFQCAIAKMACSSPEQLAAARKIGFFGLSGRLSNFTGGPRMWSPVRQLR